MDVVVNCIINSAIFCIGGCACYIFGGFCGYKCWDDVEKTPATSKNPVVNQPTSMPMIMPISTPIPRPLPEPNTDIGWTMSRPQDQPCPEIGSSCPYPPNISNSSQDPPNLTAPLSMPQPTALASTSTSSYQAKDCPPKYEDVVN